MLFIYNLTMNLPKKYIFNNEKNEKLKKERGISFEDAISAIENDGILDIYY